MIGRTISHYKIIDKLGEGGMATVYLAEDLKHERKVAVKVLRPELAAVLGAERFLSEIRVIANLQHPHIIALFDSGKADGFLYYVMPYVEGESLRAKLAAEGELPVADAVRILRDVVDALAHAHSHGVVHRDIKPDNVMLSGRHALVTDFGVAKAVSEATGRQILTTAGVALGTPAYMAPEQAAADPHIDHRADIYAVGVLAYELLAGRPPFMGTTPQEVLAAHVTEPVEPVTKHRETVPPALASLVMRCLAKRPADRWQSAEELLPQLVALATPSGGITPTGTMAVSAVAARRRTLFGAGALLGVLAVIVIRWWLSAGHGGTDADQLSARIPIAVLVFESLSAGEEAESFSEGIADDIGTQLSKISGFAVKAHASARRLSRDTMSYGEMADQLGVEYLVHGNWERAGDDVRITARLIYPQTEEQIWVENYDREWTASNLFDVRSEVAQQVAATLDLTLSPEEQMQLRAQPTENTEAYNAYKLGRFFWNKRTGADLERAVRYFEQAVALDSNYALAFVGLAETYALLAPYNVMLPEEAFPRAREAAVKTLELDSSLGQAHTVLAWTSLAYDWDWASAERGFQRAAELKQDHATTHHWYAFYLMAVGRFDDAVVEMRHAKELDPLSLIIATQTGYPFYHARDYDQAIEAYQEALLLDPNFPPAHNDLGEAYVNKGMFDEGIAEIQRALSLFPDPAYLSSLGYAYAVSGRNQEALSVLDDLRERAEHEYFSPGLFVSVYAALGESDQALEWLERAYAERWFGLFFLKVESKYDALRSDPRFQDFMRRMDFPE